jgi:AbrB family looped-hinge helix DNA binding protein
MPAATVTSKGQITIPARVRIALGLDAGDRVEFVKIEKGRFVIVPATLPKRIERHYSQTRQASFDWRDEHSDCATARRADVEKEMIELDINVLVRYLVQDDPEQSAAGGSLFDTFTAEAPGFISAVSIVELVWDCKAITKLAATTSNAWSNIFCAPVNC